MHVLYYKKWSFYNMWKWSMFWVIFTGNVQVVKRFQTRLFYAFEITKCLMCYFRHAWSQTGTSWSLQVWWVKVYFVTNRHMSTMSRSTVGQLMVDTSPTLCHKLAVSQCVCMLHFKTTGGKYLIKHSIGHLFFCNCRMNYSEIKCRSTEDWWLVIPRIVKTKWHQASNCKLLIIFHDLSCTTSLLLS